jgi:beta-galactosidase
MACHLNEVYNETGIADLPMLLGWNLYFGWYDKDIPDLGIFLDDQYKRYPNRFLLLSEYGPGADVRIFTKAPKKFDFSTDYQAKLHQSYYKQIIDRPFMVGMTAWNFADFGSEFRGDAIPHVNQKGLVQYDRTPKDVYYWYKSVLDKSEPFVHIAANFLSRITLLGNETYPIQFYSNQDEVSVSLNNQNLGNFKIENGFASIEMPLINGINTIKSISKNAIDEKIVEVKKWENLNFDTFERFGINVGSHFYFNDTEHQITWTPDQTYEKGSYGHIDGAPFNISKDKHQGIPFNILNTSSEPMFQTMLEGCTTYKIDIPNGTYKVDLFFVEPQIKSTSDIYSLKVSENVDPEKKQRIFDVSLNGELLQAHFNMASEYPEKYGIKKTGIITIKDGNGLSIRLNPIEGQPVISGILIEKIN